MDANNNLDVEDHRLCIPFDLIDGYSYIADVSGVGVALMSFRFGAQHHRQFTGIMSARGKRPASLDLLPWAPFTRRGR